MSRTVGEILGAWLEHAGLAGSSKAAQAVLRWPEFAGAAVAAHARAETVRRGTMTVSVDSSVWATELSMLTPVLLERITSALGTDVVTKLRFVVGRRGRDSARQDETLLGAPLAEPARAWPDYRDLVPVRLSPEDKSRVDSLRAAAKDPDLARAGSAWLAATLKARRWLRGHGREGA